VPAGHRPPVEGTGPVRHHPDQAVASIGDHQVAGVVPATRTRRAGGTRAGPPAPSGLAEPVPAAWSARRSACSPPAPSRRRRHTSGRRRTPPRTPAGEIPSWPGPDRRHPPPPSRSPRPPTAGHRCGTAGSGQRRHGTSARTTTADIRRRKGALSASPAATAQSAPANFPRISRIPLYPSQWTAFARGWWRRLQARSFAELAA